MADILHCAIHLATTTRNKRHDEKNQLPQYDYQDDVNWHIRNTIPHASKRTPY